MTGLLEKALERVKSLSADQQNAIAAQILETLDDEDAWDRTFHENADSFRALASAALDEHRWGETRPLEELN